MKISHSSTSLDTTFATGGVKKLLLNRKVRLLNRKVRLLNLKVQLLNRTVRVLNRTVRLNDRTLRLNYHVSPNLPTQKANLLKIGEEP